MKHATVVTSDALIDAAIARGRVIDSPRAVKVEYRPSNDAIAIHFENGNDLIVPRKNLEGLRGASKKQLARIIIEGPGTGLSWPDLNVDHYIPGLMRGIYGTSKWMAHIGRRGGAVKSVAKTVASRRNGRKGGRPKKRLATVR